MGDGGRDGNRAMSRSDRLFAVAGVVVGDGVKYEKMVYIPSQIRQVVQ